MLNKIVLDIETQKSFQEVGGRNKNHLLKVSVAVAYSYPQDKFLVFEEKDIFRLGELLIDADLVIGYNIINFDYEVLRPYLNFDLSAIPTLDLILEVEKLLGHRLSLEALAGPTLGASKIATGHDALRFWRNGELDKLKAYCIEDVKITRDLYNYALKNGKLHYKDFFETRELKISFPDIAPRANRQKQTSLF